MVSGCPWLSAMIPIIAVPLQLFSLAIDISNGKHPYAPNGICRLHFVGCPL
jgi:hypothetical protein